MNKDNLKNHYDYLYEKNYFEICNDNYVIDTQINSPNDLRFGLTLLIRPNETVINNIDKFLHKIEVVEPDQYYYPKSDLHLTALSIISCYPGFVLSKVPVNEFTAIIATSLKDIKSFGIEFKGITLSDSGILIKGFPENNSLERLRENLRVNFRKSHLEQSIDTRYSIMTAHITVMRFRTKLYDAKKFLTYLDQYADFDFGKTNIDCLEFVYNDWYQQENKVMKLADFMI